jgi:hypothetical protein
LRHDLKVARHPSGSTIERLNLVRQSKYCKTTVLRRSFQEDHQRTAKAFEAHYEMGLIITKLPLNWGSSIEWNFD